MTPASTGAAAVRPAGWKEPFHSEHSLWHHVWRLLRLQIAISLSTFRAARLRRKIGTVILALLILVFAGFIFALSWLLLSFLNSPELAEILATQDIQSVTPFLESVPVLILRGTAFAMLMLNRRTIVITWSTFVRLSSLAVSLALLPIWLEGAAIGAGALGLALATGILTYAAEKNLERECPNRVCERDKADQAERLSSEVKTGALVTDVLLGVGVVSLGIGFAID